MGKVAANIQTFSTRKFQHRKELVCAQGGEKMSPSIFCEVNDKMMPTGNNIAELCAEITLRFNQSCIFLPAVGPWRLSDT